MSLLLPTPKAVLILPARPGLPAAEWTPCLMKRSLHLWSGPPSTPAAWGLAVGESSKEVPSSLAPTAHAHTRDPLAHSQPHPTHLGLMRARPHSRALPPGLTYFIKTAASKNGGSARRPCPWPQRQTPAVSGQLRLWHPSRALTFFPPSLPPALSSFFQHLCPERKKNPVWTGLLPSVIFFPLSNVLSKAESVT